MSANFEVSNIKSSNNSFYPDKSLELGQKMTTSNAHSIPTTISVSGASVNPLSDRKSSTPDTIKPHGRVMGRKFDDSLEDLTTTNEISQLSIQFENASNVLSNPARCGIFLSYLFKQNRDPIPTLFYLVSQYFQRVSGSKELIKEQKRIALEIFTTFLHEKSPLRFEVPQPTINQLLESIMSSTAPITFNAVASFCLPVIQAQVSKLAQDIRCGMDTWRPPFSIDLCVKRSPAEELSIFELCLNGYLANLNQFISSDSSESLTQNSKSKLSEYFDLDFVYLNRHGFTSMNAIYQALSISLLTIYRYYSLSLYACSPVIQQNNNAGGFGFGYSLKNNIFARSFENLSGSNLNHESNLLSSKTNTGSIGNELSLAGSALWIKPTYFCTKLKQKSHSYGFTGRKNKYSIKGHTFQERALDRIAECWICGNLLWGLAPQGLLCNNCNIAVHLKCKSNLRETCSKELRKSFANSVLNTNQSQYTSNNMDSANTETSSIESNKTDILPSAGDNTHNSSHTKPTPMDHSLLSPSLINSFIESINLMNMSSATPNSSDHTNKVKHCGSIDSVLLNTSTPEDTKKSLPIDDFNVMDGDLRMVQQMKQKFESTDRETMLSRSESTLSRTSNLAIANCNTPSADRSSGDSTCPSSIIASDLVSELVTTDWSDDPEMMASESFEAAVELRIQFPNYQMPAKGVKCEEHLRTLVLLEFHQKTQYMVRYLKQYEYLLLRRWPVEHEHLARLLCLDRIPELIKLFRGLVTCINETKTPQGYANMAQAILAWLTNDSSANLKLWARHCQALSCSNQLKYINQILRDHVRRQTNLAPLLQMRHNKICLIDGLKQMRILYFNLPMIANNIVKDLEKKTKSYKDEAIIWQQIYAKLASLPQTIDNVCMPLVKEINSGHLCSNLDRKDLLARHHHHAALSPFQDLLINFPRTLFHYWVITYAEVTVDKLTVNIAHKVNHDYICERTQMLAILLHNALLFLIKDNDRYILRAFKTIREQGSTTGNTVNVISQNIPGNTTSMSANTMDRSSNLVSNTQVTAGNAPIVTSQSLHERSAPSSNTSLTSSSSIASVNSNQPYTTAMVNAMANIASASMIERSGTLKIAPIFPLQNVFTSCGEKFGTDYLLNIVFMEPTVLVRVLFSKEDERHTWFKFLQENNVKTMPSTTVTNRQRRPPNYFPKAVTTMAATITTTTDVSPPITCITDVPSCPLATSSSFNGSLKETIPSYERDHSPPEVRDLTCSMDDLLSPTVRLHKIISKYNLLNDELRREVCTVYEINEEQYSHSFEVENINSINRMEDLLLYQIKLTTEWLSYLSHSITKTLITPTLASDSTSDVHRKPVSRSLTTHNNNYNNNNNNNITLKEKRKNSFSWTEGCLDYSISPCSSPDSSQDPVQLKELITDQRSIRKQSYISTSSSPNLSRQEPERNTIEIQDHRRSNRRLLVNNTNRNAKLDDEYSHARNVLKLATLMPKLVLRGSQLCQRQSQQVASTDDYLKLLGSNDTLGNVVASKSVWSADMITNRTSSISSDESGSSTSTAKVNQTSSIKSTTLIDDNSKCISTAADSYSFTSSLCDSTNSVGRFEKSDSNQSKTTPKVEQLVVQDLEECPDVPLDSEYERVADKFVSEILKSIISEPILPIGTFVHVRDSGLIVSVTDDDGSGDENLAVNDNDHGAATNPRFRHVDFENDTLTSQTLDTVEISHVSDGRSVILKNSTIDQLLNFESNNDENVIQLVEELSMPDVNNSIIGRNNSQKSTTSSGFIESGDDIMTN